MATTFSKETLAKFEDASASIPLRPLDRAFEVAGLRPGKSDDGSGGARRTQFRRYVAGVDQHDKKQLQRLGNALGALIDEVADSKKEFLVSAAERDGFRLTGRVFQAASSGPRSFAVTRFQDLPSSSDLARQLNTLANRSPNDAIAGARELVESIFAMPVCDATSPAVRKCLQQLRAAVKGIDELRPARGFDSGDHAAVACARLAVGTALTLVAFVAETQQTDRERG